MKSLGSKRSRIRSLKRGCRLLSAAALLAMVMGLWASPVQAVAGGCSVRDFKGCYRTVCCIQTCLICYDSEGNIVDITCSDTYCYDSTF